MTLVTLLVESLFVALESLVVQAVLWLDSPSTQVGLMAGLCLSGLVTTWAFGTFLWRQHRSGAGRVPRGGRRRRGTRRSRRRRPHPLFRWLSPDQGRPPGRKAAS